MDLLTTACFYLAIGAGVAVALLAASQAASPVERAFRVTTAWLFWPLYVPGLLAPRRGRAELPPAGERARGEIAEGDPLQRSIQQVEAELDLALGSLDGWAEEVFRREAGRLQELRSAWRAQAERIRAMDAVLAGEEAAASHGEGTEVDVGADEPLWSREESRRALVERLRVLRRRARDELLATLAWVRELVIMVHVAKFSGAPVARAEELVAQIASAVEGLSEVARWERAGEMPAA